MDSWNAAKMLFTKKFGGIVDGFVLILFQVDVEYLNWSH
jgi:hypothetical protein